MTSSFTLLPISMKKWSNTATPTFGLNPTVNSSKYSAFAETRYSFFQRFLTVSSKTLINDDELNQFCCMVDLKKVC